MISPTLINTNDNIDVLALENRIQEVFDAQNTPYTDAEIEVESSDRCPSLYRVWCGRRQLGTFFRSYMDESWLATAFYRNGHFADETEPESFETHQQAQDYLVQAYLG